MIDTLREPALVATGLVIGLFVLLRHPVLINPLCRIVVMVCVLVSTVVLLPATVDALWEWSYKYRHAERWAQFVAMTNRNDDATLSLCSTFAELYDRNKEWGPFPPGMLHVCTAALNRNEDN